MSDFQIKSVKELRIEYSHLDAYIHKLEQKNKELEDKLALTETRKELAIDDLYETKIAPLENDVKDRKIQLESAYEANQRYQERIRSLEKVINDLEIAVNVAVGYISATQPHTDKHPMEVKKWLFEGLKDDEI